jgi:hypothetical protein
MNEGNPLSGTTNVYPRLFDFHGFGPPTYGMMVSIGVIAGLMVVFKAARQQGLDPEQMWNLGALVILAGILGAKVMLIVDDWGYYSRHPHEIFSLNVLNPAGSFPEAWSRPSWLPSGTYARTVCLSCAPATPSPQALPSATPSGAWAALPRAAAMAGRRVSLGESFSPTHWPINGWERRWE